MDDASHRRTISARRSFHIDISKLAIALLAQALLFVIWLNLPVRERYELLAHIALPLCIVFPLLAYRYLLVVPIIAFIPDIARVLGVTFPHTLISLPIVFAVASLPLIYKPRVSLIAGYATMAIIASHLIVDSRQHAGIVGVYGYPVSDLMIYSILLTIGGFLLLQLPYLTGANRWSYETRP